MQWGEMHRDVNKGKLGRTRGQTICAWEISSMKMNVTYRQR